MFFPRGACTRVSSEARGVRVRTYREQSTHKLPGVVPPGPCEPACLRTERALSGRWPEPLHKPLAKTPLPTCHLPPASTHDGFLRLLQGEVHGGTQRALPDDKSYSKRHCCHSSCPIAQVPPLRGHGDTAAQHLLCLHETVQKPSQNYPFCIAKHAAVGPYITTSTDCGATLQNQHGQRAKPHIPSTSLSTGTVAYERRYQTLRTFISHLFYLVLTQARGAAASKQISDRDAERELELLRACKYWIVTAH